MLDITFVVVVIVVTVIPNIAYIIKNTNASIKFIIGPAAATIASAFEIEYFPSKFLEFICTGLPQPKPKSIKHINPTGSIWLIGFKLSLPCCLGVSSPSFVAAHACANSWNVIATITPGKEIIIPWQYMHLS